MKKLPYVAPSDPIKNILDALLSEGGVIVKEERYGHDLKKGLSDRIITVKFNHLLIMFNESKDGQFIEITDLHKQTMLIQNSTLLNHPKQLKLLIAEYNQIITDALKHQMQTRQPKMKVQKP